MDAGLGEVTEPAGVVQVEVRDDDVAHVRRVEPERGDLAHGRLRARSCRGRTNARKGCPSLVGSRTSPEPEAGVDQHQGAA